MSMSDYMRWLRDKVGAALVLVPSVTVLVADDRDRVLLVRATETGQWVIPGGAIEPGETPADAAVREMWEETGVHVELTRVLGVYGGPEFRVTYGNGDELAFVMTAFEGRARGGTPRADRVETLEARFLSAVEIAALDLPEWARLVLADGFVPRRGTRFRAPTWAPPLTPGRPHQ